MCVLICFTQRKPGRDSLSEAAGDVFVGDGAAGGWGARVSALPGFLLALLVAGGQRGQN